MVLNTDELRALVREEMRPLEVRLQHVEQGQAEAEGARRELRELVLEQYRLGEAAAERRHAVVLKRMEQSEAWIARRRRIEQAVVGIGRLALLGWLRRFLPFVLIFSGIMALSFVLFIATR
jgi:hypothetical protein